MTDEKKPAEPTEYVALWQSPQGWVALPKRYSVPPRQRSTKARDAALADLAVDQPDATEFTVVVLPALYWEPETFEKEPPPPPGFKPKTA